MRVLSVDLANTTYTNLGIIILEETRDSFSARSLSARDIGLTGPPSPHDLATKLVDACQYLAVPIILLDGPQGWKHPDNGLHHSRICERVLILQARLGFQAAPSRRTICLLSLSP